MLLNPINWNNTVVYSLYAYLKHFFHCFDSTVVQVTNEGIYSLNIYIFIGVIFFTTKVYSGPLKVKYHSCYRWEQIFTLEIWDLGQIVASKIYKRYSFRRFWPYIFCQILFNPPWQIGGVKIFFEGRKSKLNLWNVKAHVDAAYQYLKLNLATSNWK